LGLAENQFVEVGHIAVFEGLEQQTSSDSLHRLFAPTTRQLPKVVFQHAIGDELIDGLDDALAGGGRAALGIARATGLEAGSHWRAPPRSLLIRVLGLEISHIEASITLGKVKVQEAIAHALAVRNASPEWAKLQLIP